MCLAQQAHTAVPPTLTDYRIGRLAAGRIKFLRGQARLVRHALGSSRRGWSREKRDHEAEKPMMSE